MKESNLEKRLHNYYQEQGKRYSIGEASDFRQYMLRRLGPKRLADEILGQISPMLGKSTIVLDVGCGRGWYLDGVARECSQAIRIDVSWGHLLQAKRFLKDKDTVSLIQCHACRLPFKDESIDIILFIGVMEHLLSPRKALEEIRRVLKKEGEVLICVPSILNPSEWEGRLINIAQGHFQDHMHFYTPHSAKHFVEKAGFRIIKMKTACFLPLLFSGTEIKTPLGRKVYNLVEDMFSRFPGINLLGSNIIIRANKED